MNEFVLSMLQKVLLIVIQIFVPLGVAWLVRRVLKLMEQAERRQWWDTVEGLAREAAHAAEQLALAEDFELYYSSKKVAAITIFERWLDARGVPLDIDPYWSEIEDIIESEVDRINARA